LAVSIRRPEFATRLALGASVVHVARLVVAQALRLAAIGAIPGAVLGLTAGHAMRRMLYGVTPLDPLNMAGLSALIAAVVVAASLAPALRAARVNIIEEIRSH
jgi:ABC-type antimicrobial peptide transport system permease subunit